jgi:hypothetical protein
MKKAETIERYGEDAYARQLEQRQAYYKAHREEEIVRVKKYNEEHPEEVIAKSQEQHRKGGKYYDKHLKDQQTGIPGDKNKIRGKHRKQYHPYKMIIAPGSQIHHEWVPETAEYRGVALVEAEQHIHGFVDVIEILDGKITLLTEEEVREGKKKNPKL